MTIGRLVWLLALAGAGACATAHQSPTVTGAPRIPPETLVRQSVGFTAEARVADESGVHRLTVFLRIGNLADTTVQIESASDNCEPALEFADTVSGQRFVWSHASWRRRHEPLIPAPLNDVTCVGTGLIVTVAGKQSGELGRQSYLVTDIRGDSIPAGPYRVRVPAVIYDGARRQVIALWSAAVDLR
jgi:hypothetical protein